MIIMLLAIFGLCFILSQVDGPWNCLSLFRNYLFRNKHVGVFFYKLFNCPVCFGFHAGWFIYLLVNFSDGIQFNLLICWALTGSAVNLIFTAVLAALHKYSSN